MNFFNALTLNIKKSQVRLKQTLFFVVPLLILTALSVVIASGVANFKQATDDAIFSTLANQSTIIQLTKQQSNRTPGQPGGGGGQFAFGQNELTEADLNTAKSIDHVQSATLNYSLPINQLNTTDLVTGSTISINNLTVLSSDAATLYTDKNFAYTQGQPIPIIINANSMQETYEDWKNQTSITVALPQRGASQRGQNQSQNNAFRDQFPTKQRAVTYNKDQLIGKTFSITIGGLDATPDYTQSFDQTTGITFSKLTDQAIADAETARQTTISTYWDYSKLKAGTSYQFVVAGIINSDSNRSVYVPESAASAMVSNYISNQANARTATSIPATLLNSTFTGTTYDGVTLTDSTGGGRGGPGGINLRDLARGGSSTASASYKIPGLIIQTNANDGTVTGAVTDSTIFDTAQKTSQSMTIKVDSVYNRTTVVKALNDKGYVYQDASTYSVFEQLQSTLKTISAALIIGFLVLTTLVIAFNMSKLVSDSTREIGVFRAIGFSKGSIITLFGQQGVLLTLVGAIGGIIIGLIATLLSSGAMKSWFDGFVGKTITQSFGVTPQIADSLFRTIDWKTTGILVIALIIVSLIVSLFLANRASKISPTEAVKA